MRPQRILIVGAGIAGTAAAAFLGRAGHLVTVVERAAQSRSSGSPVDIRGDALRVARELGILTSLTDADTGVRRVRFLDAAGRTSAIARLRAPRSPDLEVPRSSLSSILREVAGSEADIVDGDEPHGIEVDAAGVDVTLASGARARFDLVIGADGQHSAVRRMVWGPEADVRSPLGLAIATARISMRVESTEVLLHNEPGVSVGIHPAGGRTVASFIFRTGIADPPRGRVAQEELLNARCSTVGWRADELLAAVRGSTDLYLDVVSRIRVPSWIRGRVALIGDAASSVTILGDGSSVALTAAARLSAALDRHGDLRSALEAYERAVRPEAERRQRGARFGAAVLVPRTTAGIAVRDLAVRIARQV